MDARNCMGGSCTISFSGDCYKTFPWTATKTDRISHRDCLTMLLFCRVSQAWMWLSFFCWNSWHTRFAVVACFTLGFTLFPTLWVRRSVTDICIRPLSFLQTSSITSGVIQILWFTQMFALGLRLILSGLPRWVCSKFWRRNCHDCNWVPGGYTCAIYQWWSDVWFNKHSKRLARSDEGTREHWSFVDSTYVRPFIHMSHSTTQQFAMPDPLHDRIKMYVIWKSKNMVGSGGSSTGRVPDILAGWAIERGLVSEPTMKVYSSSRPVSGAEARGLTLQERRLQSTCRGPGWPPLYTSPAGRRLLG